MKLQDNRNSFFYDVSGRAILSLSGRDARDLLHRISTNDINDFKQNGFIQTILTNEKGKIVDLVTVLEASGELLLAGHTEDAEGLGRWIEKFIIMEDAGVRVIKGRFLHLIVFGGKAESAHLVQASGMMFQETMGTETLSHILVPEEWRRQVLRTLTDSGIKEADKEAFDEFRISGGIPESPAELCPDYNPLEAGLHHLISWTKGCYVGQEVIARLDTYKKVQKELRRMRFSENPSSLPCVIYQGKDEAGVLTTTSRKPGPDIVGLGYVRKSAVGDTRLYFRRDSNQVPVIVEN